MPTKKGVEGQNQRLALTRRYVQGIDLSGIVEQRRRLEPGNVEVDDLIDAIACLTTAFRVMTNTAFSLPNDQDERNARGLRMEIVA